jgi:hypothetical protein
VAFDLAAVHMVATALVGLALAVVGGWDCVFGDGEPWRSDLAGGGSEHEFAWIYKAGQKPL